MDFVEFRGCSLDDLRSFPTSVMREAEYPIDRLQNGLLLDDFKSMTSVGNAVAEIRIWDEAGNFSGDLCRQV